jgi:hypothetical protein
MISIPKRNISILIITAAVMLLLIPSLILIVNGDRDEVEGIEIRTDKRHYRYGENITFHITSHLDEAIVEPLGSIHDDAGNCIDAGGRAAVMPPPMLYPGETKVYTWNPSYYPQYYGRTIGRFYLMISEGDKDYTRDFWIWDLDLPPDSDRVPESDESDLPFLTGPV